MTSRSFARPSTSANPMRRVNDPALFVSIYLDKEQPRPAETRQTILEQLETFTGKYGLQPDSAPIPYSRATHIDLPALERTSHEYQLLFRAQTNYPSPPAGTFYQCLAYVYHDALVVQIQITKFADWVGSFTQGWEQLVGELTSGFDSGALAAPGQSMLGLSVVYWAITHQHEQPGAYEPELRQVAAGHDLHRTDTDLGSLWRCELQVLCNAGAFHQDLWMLMTPRASEPEVNKRYYRPTKDNPPYFTDVSLARHKMLFEFDQHSQARRILERRGKLLDDSTATIIKIQRRLGRELDALRSDRAVEFQRKLGRLANRISEYGYTVRKLQSLRRTLMVNRRIYLTHSVALISSNGMKEIGRSRDQEKAATDFLDNVRNDEIFNRDLGHIQGKLNQLNSDIDYANLVIERNSVAMRAAADQLRIAGEREIGEIARHISVDSAAVVASVAAILVIELAVKGRLEAIHATPKDWFLALWVIVGTFGLTQILGSGLRGGNEGQLSIIFACGCLAAWVTTEWQAFPRLYHGRDGIRLQYVLAIVVGLLLGYLLYSFASHCAQWARRKRLHKWMESQQHKE